MPEAVRRGFPGSLLSQYMHSHNPFPTLLKGCLLGRLGVGKGLTLVCQAVTQPL